MRKKFSQPNTGDPELIRIIEVLRRLESCVAGAAEKCGARFGKKRERLASRLARVREEKGGQGGMKFSI